MGAAAAALGGAYYLFTTYLQDVLGYNSLQAGLAFVPLTLVSMAASLKLTGALLGRWGVRTPLFVGMLVNGIGMVLLATGMAAGASFWTVLAGLLVWGLGGGLTFPAMFVAAASGVAPGEQGVASALATTSQQIGGAIGLAVLVAIANAGLDLHPGAAPAPTAIVEGLRVALWTGGIASMAGGLLAFLLKRQPEASQDVTTSTMTSAGPRSKRSSPKTPTSSTWTGPPRAGTRSPARSASHAKSWAISFSASPT
ncbi:MFS transporter [Amycolatopsis sp. NPDC051045]|uniref:MFS transporter n=1 Tax=Amycolatopsis sp. NPDC051045 TaxID=3156922 RepID=UPI003415CBFA